MLSRIRESETAGQFIRFSVVGASGFMVCVGTYTVLTRVLHVFPPQSLTANAIAFCCAVVNNFTWNRLWAFRPRPQQRTSPVAVAAGGASAPAAEALAAPEPVKVQQQAAGAQFVIFTFVSLVGLGLNTLIFDAVGKLSIAQTLFNGYSDYFAIVVATAIVWFWNFGANKLWTFRPR